MLKPWKELARDKEWARQLIHQLAPNARAAEWWFTSYPIDIIVYAIQTRGKSPD